MLFDNTLSPLSLAKDIKKETVGRGFIQTSYCLVMVEYNIILVWIGVQRNNFNEKIELKEKYWVTSFDVKFFWGEGCF